jgi:hypothetical protein
MRFPRHPQLVPTTLDWPDTVSASTARSVKAIQASDLHDVSDTDLVSLQIDARANTGIDP